jgi:transposase
MARNYIGVDLSKDALDVCDPVRGVSRIANNPAVVAGWLGSLGADDLVVFEATSRCDRTLRRALRSTARAGAQLNPLHAWHFARSLNLPKTDKVDAAMLARLGAERQLGPGTAISVEREELRALVQRRDQLKRMETQEKNRLHDDPPPFVAEDVRAVLADLARRVAAFDQAITDHIDRHPDLKRASGLLRSIPGIGPVTAAVLLGDMPELGHADRREIASLGGLAPRAHESGRTRGRRFIGAGRRHVRRALFMAALSIPRRPGFLAGFVAKQKAAGKPGRVVRIAVARRLLTIANAVLRDGVPFQKEFPQAA